MVVNSVTIVAVEPPPSPRRCAFGPEAGGTVAAVPTEGIVGSIMRAVNGCDSFGVGSINWVEMQGVARLVRSSGWVLLTPSTI
jgi:hypothetical protein